MYDSAQPWPPYRVSECKLILKNFSMIRGEAFEPLVLSAIHWPQTSGALSKFSFVVLDLLALYCSFTRTGASWWSFLEDVKVEGWSRVFGERRKSMRTHVGESGPQHHWFVQWRSGMLYDMDLSGKGSCQRGRVFHDGLVCAKGMHLVHMQVVFVVIASPHILPAPEHQCHSILIFALLSVSTIWGSRCDGWV